MKLWIGRGTLMMLVLWANARATKYEPQIAMVCGKVTQHVDLTTGEWVTDVDRTADCLKDKDAILDYCRKVYPGKNITNYLEKAEKIHIASWCAVGSSGACKGHPHNVVPTKCIVGTYQTSPLTVPDTCHYQYKSDHKECHGSEYWYAESAKACQMKGQTVSAPQMLSRCVGVDSWAGVHFECCDTPTRLHKPKPNKSKPKMLTTPASKIDEQQDVNPICLQPKLVGLCRALLPAWHYDATSGECLFFHYGGCGGNDNNFDSQAECEKTCIPAVKKEKRENDVCGLPSEVGMCRAFFTRWFYDVELGECLTFVYGGCGGNENKFMQQEDCEKHCRGYKKPPSYSPLSAESPPLIPIGMGPVMYGSLPPVDIERITKGTTSTTTSATTSPSTPTTASTVGIIYEESSDLNTEHTNFVNKLDALKSERGDKLNAILGKWDKAKTNGQPEDLEQLEMDMQVTISGLEDQYNEKFSQLSQYHMSRVDEMLAEKRAKALQHFLNQLNADSPKVHHVLSTLEKYINVEIEDKTHTLKHLDIANNEELHGENIPALKIRLTDIEKRVNETKGKLDLYPTLLSVIKNDVESLLSKLPPTPEEDAENEEDNVDEDIVDFIDQNEEESTTIEPIKIDDGGLIDPDDYSETCTLPPDHGPCEAYGILFYFDSLDNVCKEFVYGGCQGNKNKFSNMEECMNACAGSTMDDNSIQFNWDDVDDEFEDESKISEEVDKMFDANGNLKPDFDVKLNEDPQALVSSSGNDDVKYGGVGTTWFIWLGVGLGVVTVLALIITIASRNRSHSTPTTVVVNTEEESTKELTPEESQLLQLQQNGYENPTYKFFEKQIA